MPNPDGQIITRDLSQGAVTTTKIANAAITTAKIDDAAITTAKIDDLAVTNATIANATILAGKIGDQQVDIQRMLDPVWAATDRGLSSANITTFPAVTGATHTTSVPTWVGTVYVTTIGMIHHIWGTTQTLSMQVHIAGGGGDLFTHALTAGVRYLANQTYTRTVVAPGSSITNDTRAYISSTTETAPSWVTQSVMLGIR